MNLKMEELCINHKKVMVMKKTYKFIIAALAATMSLASCTQDYLDEQGNNSQAEGIRTIAVSFGPQTRTALADDGLAPQFKVDEDVILVAQDDGRAKPVECRVENIGGKNVIRTKLQGKLTLVYPVSAAKMDTENEWAIAGVNVPSTQTGKFADANICMTKVVPGEDVANFENKVAILRFYVDESIGVTGINLSSVKGIATGTDKITVGSAQPVNKEEGQSITPKAKQGVSGTVQTLDQITDGPDNRICYVAVNPVDIKGLRVVSHTTTQGDVTRDLQSYGYLRAGTMYNIFIPYYISVNVGTEADPEIQQWAYCNLGAFLPEEYGDYFAWGETTGHKANAEKTGFVDNHEFSWKNCPFNNGAETYNSDNFTSVQDDVCPRGVLAKEYDAAYAQWSGKWRIPTTEEWYALIQCTNTTNSNFSNGRLTINGTSLFLPAAGASMYHDGTLSLVGSDGRYWSSTLSTYSSTVFQYNKRSDWACTLIFGSNSPSVGEGTSERTYGHPIRPIYGDLAKDVPSDIEPYEQGPNL